MPSLRELQFAFADAVLATEGPVAATLLREPAAERIEVYRTTVRTNYRNALAASYQVVRQLVGGPFFDAAVDAYVNTHPSRGGDLNTYGASFGEFLATYVPATELPYLADVARLEWAQDEGSRAADYAPNPDLVLASLAITAPEQLPALRLRLDPSLRLVASAFPILHIWRIHQSSASADEHVSLDEGGDSLLVRRDRERRTSPERITPATHAWLEALGVGERFGAALEAALRADPAFDLDSNLHESIASGVIAAVVRG